MTDFELAFKAIVCNMADTAVSGFASHYFNIKSGVKGKHVW